MDYHNTEKAVFVGIIRPHDNERTVMEYLDGDRKEYEGEAWLGFRSDTDDDVPVVLGFFELLVDSGTDVAVPFVRSVDPVRCQERIEVADFHGVVDGGNAKLDNFVGVVAEVDADVEDFLRDDVFEREHAAARRLETGGSDERVDGCVLAVDHATRRRGFIATDEYESFSGRGRFFFGGRGGLCGRGRSERVAVGRELLVHERCEGVGRGRFNN